MSSIEFKPHGLFWKEWREKRWWFLLAVSMLPLGMLAQKAYFWTGMNYTYPIDRSIVLDFEDYGIESIVVIGYIIGLYILGVTLFHRKELRPVDSPLSHVPIRSYHTVAIKYLVAFIQCLLFSLALYACLLLTGYWEGKVRAAENGLLVFHLFSCMGLPFLILAAVQRHYIPSPVPAMFLAGLHVYFIMQVTYLTHMNFSDISGRYIRIPLLLLIFRMGMYTLVLTVLIAIWLAVLRAFAHLEDFGPKWRFGLTLLFALSLYLGAGLLYTTSIVDILYLVWG